MSAPPRLRRLDVHEADVLRREFKKQVEELTKLIETSCDKYDLLALRLDQQRDINIDLIKRIKELEQR